MKKIIKILGITFMSLMIAAFTVEFFADVQALGQVSELEEGALLKELTPLFWTYILMSVVIITLGIVGLVKTARSLSENNAFGFSAASMMTLSLFFIIGLIQTYAITTDYAEKISTERTPVDGPAFPYLPVLVLVGILVVLLISLCYDYRKKGLVKSILSAVGYSLLLIFFTMSMSSTSSVIKTSPLTTLLYYSMILGFIAMSIVGIIDSSKEQSPVPAKAVEAGEGADNSSDIASKLKTLKELHENGLISDEDYKAKSSKYIDLL
jgi:hypothetical protein